MKPKIIIYVKQGCPFCTAAETLFAAKGLEYKKIDYYALSQKEMEELYKKTNNHPTAPLIFIDGEFYGGYDEVKELDDKGELENILGMKK